MKLTPYSPSLAALILMGAGTNTNLSSNEISMDPRISISYKALNFQDNDDYCFLEIQETFDDKDKFFILQQFSKDIILHSEPLDQEILELLNDSYWNLF